MNIEYHNFLNLFNFFQCIYIAILHNARGLNFETSCLGFDLSRSSISYSRSTCINSHALRTIEGELSKTLYCNLHALTSLYVAAQPDHRIIWPQSYSVLAFFKHIATLGFSVTGFY